MNMFVVGAAAVLVVVIVFGILVLVERASGRPPKLNTPRRVLDYLNTPGHGMQVMYGGVGRVLYGHLLWINIRRRSRGGWEVNVCRRDAEGHPSILFSIVTDIIDDEEVVVVGNDGSEDLLKRILKMADTDKVFAV